MRCRRNYCWCVSLMVLTLALGGCDEPEAETDEPQEVIQADESADETDETDETEAELRPDDPAAIDALLAEESDAERPEWLQKAWKWNSPEVGSGIGATMHLFEDGLFVFHRGYTDICKEGVISRVGSWKFDDEELVIREQRRLEGRGGERQEDDSDCYLPRVDSERVVLIHDEPVEERLKLEECSKEERQEFPSYDEELNADCRYFGEQLHWTTAAGTNSWRDDWKEWFADQRVVDE